jgi:hypothetical protein
MARKKAVPAQIKIRLPEALRRDLEREAAKNGRTLNGEIVHRLTQPFERADREDMAAEAAYATAVAIAKQFGGGPVEMTWGRDKEGRRTWSVFQEGRKAGEPPKSELQKPTEGEKK